jgi:hypothetical protein
VPQAKNNPEGEIFLESLGFLMYLGSLERALFTSVLRATSAKIWGKSLWAKFCFGSWRCMADYSPPYLGLPKGVQLPTVKILKFLAAFDGTQCPIIYRHFFSKF